MRDDSIIFDLETFGQDPDDHPIISLSVLTFNFQMLEKHPYSFSELVDKAHFIKFDVLDQVKNHKKKIDKETLDWWGQQGPEAMEQLTPTKEDRLITDLPRFWSNATSGIENLKGVWTRNNTFDPSFLRSVYKSMGLNIPYPFYLIRDTKTHIKALTYGEKLKDDFIPESCTRATFIKHHPSYDVAMDVMRLQYLQRVLYGPVDVPVDDDIPF